MEKKQRYVRLYKVRRKIKRICIIGNPIEHRERIILPVSLGPCLKYYSIISQEKELKNYFIPIIRKYFDIMTNVKELPICELCECSTLDITAHHLVPRCVHRFAHERGWGPGGKRGSLHSIAWLCRGCHLFVHRILDPIALAEHYWTVQLLLRRTEIWQYVETTRRLVREVD